MDGINELVFSLPAALGGDEITVTVNWEGSPGTPERRQGVPENWDPGESAEISVTSWSIDPLSSGTTSWMMAFLNDERKHVVGKLADMIRQFDAAIEDAACENADEWTQEQVGALIDARAEARYDAREEALYDS